MAFLLRAIDLRKVCKKFSDLTNIHLSVCLRKETVRLKYQSISKIEISSFQMRF